MKSKFLLTTGSFCLFLGLNVFAQTNDNFTGTIDSMLLNVDKTPITSGILYDRAFILAGLHVFNKFSSDTSSYMHYLQGYNELYMAAYNRNTMPNPDSVVQISLRKKTAGIIPIGLFNYRFHTIDSLAVDQNLLSYSNGLLYDVPNRPRVPFYESTVTVAAALIDSTQNKTVTFEFPSALYQSNTGNSIALLYVDFNNGSGLQRVYYDTPVTVSYNDPGTKTIKYVITYGNNQVITTYSSLYVNGRIPVISRGQNNNAVPCNGLSFPETLNIESDISYQGYEETIGFKGQGVATIFYHTTDCDRVLKKPIIILDGFDPGSERTFDKLLPLLEYDNISGGRGKLAEEMVDKGYDVIILDYPRYSKAGRDIDGGSDYIQRNAFTLMKLINTINSIKENNGEKLVVIGPSMGGLISRYALAYMEQNGMNHNTRLWVSFDSPHLGANIPIGDQRMLQYLADRLGVGDAKEKLNSRLNTPAAKEMIIHHYLSGSETPAPHWTRNNFMQELNNLGYPTQLRRVALVNGSVNGTLFTSPGQQVIDISVNPSNFTRVIGIGAVIFSPIFITRLIGAIFGFKSDYIRTKVWFTPGYNGNNRVFEGSALGLFKKRNYNAGTPPNSVGLDVIPGGYFDTQQQIKAGVFDGVSGTIRVFLKAKENIPTFNIHSFIPAKSALAITSISNFGEALNTRNFVSTGETPFNSYYIPERNEEHVFLTNCSVNWITKEIDNDPQQPVGIKYTISGPDTFCQNSTYELTGLPQGATLSWSASGGVEIASTPTPLSVTVQKIGYDNTGILTATITNAGCSTKVITKELTYGSIVRVVVTTDRYPQPSNYIYETARADQIPGTSFSDYVWHEEINGQLGNVIATGPTLSNWPVPPCGVKYYRLDVPTACGIATYRGYVYNNYGCGYRISYSPNPANETMTLKPTKSENEKASGEAYSYKVYDKQGNVIRQGKSNAQYEAVIDTRNIPSDNYFLHIIYPKETIKEQIIIQH